MMRIASTLQKHALRVAIYSDIGVGKSTFASKAPSPVFICAEEGLSTIDARCVEPPPKTWEEVLESIEFLSNEPSVQSIVIDSLDWLEPLCWDFTCRQAKNSKIKMIEDFGYGKGYVAATLNWRVLLGRLGALRALGKHVILICHAHVKTVRNPLGDDYERWQLKFQPMASGVVREWVDVLGFAQLEVSTFESDDPEKRVKANTTGRRVLCTSKSPAYDSKNRCDMPETIPLDWSIFMAHATAEPRSVVLATVEKELERLPAVRAEMVRPHLEKASREALQALLTKIRSEVSTGTEGEAS